MSLKQAKSDNKPTGMESPTAKLLRLYVEHGRDTQYEVAQAAGIRGANAITMFKQGKTKVPLARIPALAKILRFDANAFMRIAMEEYRPDIYDAICEIYGGLPTVNEVDLLKRYRELTHGKDPKIKNRRQEVALERFVATLLDNDSPSALNDIPASVS